MKLKSFQRMENFNYIMFENSKNNCWLDAAIVLIANSKNIKDVIETVSGPSQIEYVVSAYNNAQAILNDENMPIPDRFAEARTKLQEIQINTLFYLEKFLKFKAGEPESAFCALYTLFHQDDPRIKEIVNISWFWVKNCNNCGLNSKTSLFTKSIITLAKVSNYFQPASPTNTYICSCKTEQEMKLVYKELPNCLMFHFEKGAGRGNSIPLQFAIDAREYHLTGIVILEKGTEVNLNHFVTWVRQPFLDMWLNCNDLNTALVKYCKTKPEMELKDLFMCLYEAFDDFGVIRHNESIDDEQAENMNAELIYLSDEGEDTRSSPTNVVMEPSVCEQKPLGENINSVCEQKPLGENINSVCEQKPLGEKINSIAAYLAKNMLIEEIGECKKEHDTSQASKIPDAENVSNSEDCNIAKTNESDTCMSSTGQFSGAIEHKVENLTKKTGILSMSEDETKELDMKVEILNDLNQKDEVIKEPLVRIKSVSDECEENDGKDKKMPLSHKIKKNISQNATIELEKTCKKSSKSISLSSQSEKNSLLEKREITGKKLISGTSKATEEPDVNGFEVEDNNENKTSNDVLNEACGTVRKKTIKEQGRKAENNDKRNKKVIDLKPTYDESELKKLVDDNVERVFAHFMLQMCDKAKYNIFAAQKPKSVKE